jgi:hypothetical protein
MKRTTFPWVPLALVAVLMTFPRGGSGAAHSAIRASRIHRNAIPPRLQWNANSGYCGEVSLISAGLYYGQYMSQYEARICAIGNTPQDKGEMLLGVNDRHAASKMRLNSIEWDGRKQRSTDQFLRWVKRHVACGFPVIIGVFNNEYLLYGNTDPEAGDPQYDHIVPVVGIRSHHALSNRAYFGGDRLTFSDNGLWGDARDRPYHFSYSFKGFPGSRQQANARNGPVYSLPDYGRNYGIVITGVMDRNGDTLPVRVTTNKNDERPAMERRSNARPEPMPLTLTITVSGLTPNAAYRLYRYDNLEKIPDSQFNAHAARAAESWNIRISDGSTFTLTQEILSDEIAAYRCVRATAP